MDDYALVLNAGSSSLKFCVFQRPAGERWGLEARGQIEGIGTSPSLSVKDAVGETAGQRKSGSQYVMDAMRLMRWRMASIQIWRIACAGCWSSRRPRRSAV